MRGRPRSAARSARNREQPPEPAAELRRRRRGVPRPLERVRRAGPQVRARAAPRRRRRLVAPPATTRSVPLRIDRDGRTRRASPTDPASRRRRAARTSRARGTPPAGWSRTARSRGDGANTAAIQAFVARSRRGGTDAPRRRPPRPRRFGASRCRIGRARARSAATPIAAERAAGSDRRRDPDGRVRSPARPRPRRRRRFRRRRPLRGRAPRARARATRDRRPSTRGRRRSGGRRDRVTDTSTVAVSAGRHESPAGLASTDNDRPRTTSTATDAPCGVVAARRQARTSTTPASVRRERHRDSAARPPTTWSRVASSGTPSRTSSTKTTPSSASTSAASVSPTVMTRADGTMIGRVEDGSNTSIHTRTSVSGTWRSVTGFVGTIVTIARPDAGISTSWVATCGSAVEWPATASVTARRRRTQLDAARTADDGLVEHEDRHARRGGRSRHLDGDEDALGATRPSASVTARTARLAERGVAAGRGEVGVRATVGVGDRDRRAETSTSASWPTSVTFAPTTGVPLTYRAVDGDGRAFAGAQREGGRLDGDRERRQFERADGERGFGGGLAAARDEGPRAGLGVDEPERRGADAVGRGRDGLLDGPELHLRTSSAATGVPAAARWAMSRTWTSSSGR